MKSLMLLPAFLVSMIVAHIALAQTFVCGDSMVQTGVGTTKEEVESTCGPPTTKTQDRWYYANQPGQITVVLTFENGFLQQIENVPQE